MTIKLWCEFGEHFWYREKKPGRKPKYCPEHAHEKWIIQRREWRIKNPDGEKKSSLQWRKNNSDKLKINAKRHRERNPGYNKQYYEKNRSKINKINLDWKKNNPDKVRASNARRRALKRNAQGNITAEEFKAICAEQNHCCVYCGKNKFLTMDHVIPLSKGGAHEASNIVGACFTCNCSKYYYTANEFLERKSKLYGKNTLQ